MPVRVVSMKHAQGTQMNGLIPIPPQLPRFVRLPDDGYTPLPYDPRTGFIDGGEADLFYDYGAPLGQPVKRGYARRHRLEKKHPEREKSEAVEPIVYYGDSGVPEPIRSALVEGAS